MATPTKKSLKNNSENTFCVIDIVGIKIHLIELGSVLEKINYWITKKRSTPRSIAVTGFHGLHVAMEDPEFRNILSEAELFVPDGIAPLWIARLLGKKDSGRVTGSDLMRGFFEMANKSEFSSYFFGDTDITLQALTKKVSEKYPGHRIAGAFSPPFRDHSEDEKQKMIDTINQSKPDVLWVGLGLPKQERWIHENRDKLNVPVIIGVGAAFGFHSGTVKRVPEWIGNMGFEWVWRFLTEPKKLWRRDLIDGPKFLFQIAKNWQKIKKANGL